MNKAELEQEAELYSYDVPIYQVEAQLEKIQKAYLASAEPREKRITKLEKENDELKETVTKMNNIITETFSNLTKAKDIIKYLLSFIQKEGYRTRWDINIEQAERFLKKSE